jgi:hypothetical protein
MMKYRRGCLNTPGRLPTAFMNELAIYLHLAQASHRRRRPLVRDKLLVLAGVIALGRNLDQIAQYCRQLILTHNPAHLVGHWASFDAALADDDFRIYLRRLARLYPLEKAEHMLQSWGIDLARERNLYLDDHEYAAGILGATPDLLAASTLQPPVRRVECGRGEPRAPFAARLSARLKSLVRFVR